MNDSKFYAPPALKRFAFSLCGGILGVAFLLLLNAGSNRAAAQSIVGAAEYYVPGDEADMLAAVRAIPPSSGANYIESRLNLVASANDVNVYIDEWENGYSFDASNPANTSDARWDASGGAGGGGYQGAALTIGQVLSLTLSNRYCTDSQGINAGDRIFTTGAPVFVERTCWPNSPGTYISGCWPLFPVKFWDSSYVVPVGEDLEFGGRPFAYTFLFFVPPQGNTRVVIKSSAGTTLYDQVLGRGENGYLAGIDSGTTIDAMDATTLAPVPIQAGLLTSTGAGTYDTRYYTLIPRALVSYEYFIGVPSMQFPTGEFSGRDVVSAAYIIAYQDDTEITIENYANSFTITLDKNEVYRYVMPRMARGVTSGYFAARIAATDSNNKVNVIVARDDQIYDVDWGCQGLPTSLLSDNYFLPYCPYNPIYVTPVNDHTQFYIDRDNDGVVDVQFELNRFQTRMEYPPSPSYDFSGAHIYSSGPAFVAWGQDNSEQGTGEPSPDLDQGFTVLPLTWMDPILAISKTADPSQLPSTGGTVDFTIVVSSRDNTIYHLNINDTLPAGWEYINDSSVITFDDGTASSTMNPSGTPGPDLTWALDHTLPPSKNVTVAFQARTTTGYSTGYNFNWAEAVGASVSNTSDPNIYYLRPNVFAKVFIAASNSATLSISKTSNASTRTGPNDGINYTVTVTNTGASTANNITVHDMIPEGVNYVDASSSVGITLHRSLNVRDQFDSQNYSLNSGSWNWATNWQETGDDGSASSGQIYILSSSGSYRLRVAGNNQRYIQREVNLSGYEIATLTFQRRRSGLDNSSDYVTVEMSSNGASGPWQEIYRFAGSTNDSSYVSESRDISEFISANTRIRFRTSSTLGNSDIVYFDNVDIAYSKSPAVVYTSVNPPWLAPGYDLLAGEQMTVNFWTKLIQPEAAGITQIDNTARVSATNVSPMTASHSFSLATIGDFIFRDLNGNGAYDSGIGESPIQGPTITLTGFGGDLILGTSDDINYGVLSANSGGEYRFLGLAPGRYRASVTTSTLPLAAIVTTPGGAVLDFTIPAGQDYVEADFGAQQQGSVQGHIWQDTDGNRRQDAGEPNIANATVNITDSYGVVRTAVTNSSGEFSSSAPIGSNVTNVREGTLPFSNPILTTANDPATSTVMPAAVTQYHSVGYTTIPLLVVLDSFSATASGYDSPVDIHWTTAAEVLNAGFHIHRAIVGKSGYAIQQTRITDSMIPAAGSEAQGASYSFIDTEPLAKGEERLYFLEDIDLAGLSTFHGPARTTITSLRPARVPDWFLMQ